MTGQLLEFRGQVIFVPAGVSLPDVEQSILSDLVGFRNGKDGLNGRDGRDGLDGKNGSNGRDGVGLAGKDGQDGRPGRGLDGKDGRDGKDGVGIDQISQPTDEIALFELSNGKKFEIRLPRGKDGKDGRDSEGRTVVVNRFVESPSVAQEAVSAAQTTPTLIEENKIFMLASNSQTPFTDEIDMQEGAEVEFEDGSVITEVN